MVGYPFSNIMKDCLWKAKCVGVKSLRHRTLTGSEIAGEISNSIFLSFFFFFRPQTSQGGKGQNSL